MDGAALQIPADPEEHRTLARVVLGLLADAGMSSLTYNAISAQSGIGATSLQRIWTSRVDAVTQAMAEIYGENPVPDTGDLSEDLRAYVDGWATTLAEPRARQMLAALVAEAEKDPELDDALREQVLRPRCAELTRRIALDSERADAPVEEVVEQLVDTLCERALLLDVPVDDEVLRDVVAMLVGAAPKAEPATPDS